METGILFSAVCPKFLILLPMLATVRTTSLMCPDGCNCDGGFPATSLTVDCQRNVNVSAEQLTEQLDSLLSSNLTYGHLRSLTITNSPLTNVPLSVCRLTTLTQLNLAANQLTRLRDNCLSNLTALTSFSAYRNSITELQDGLFDGLSKLQTLILARNCISSIGLRVFNSSAMLTSLKNVDFLENNIQTLEPWPMYLGLNGQDGHRVTIDLSHNSINASTNRMGWKAPCGRETVSFRMHLNFNRIKHISDILHGWGINMTFWYCLNPQRPGVRPSVIEFEGNPWVCDCVDFDILKVLRLPYSPTTVLVNTFCTGPADLYGSQINNVKLDQLVCELTERCPSGCRCVHRPANITLHIHCSNTNLTALPLELPKLPKSYTKYKLDFSNNRGLYRLEHRDYFANTSILDVSNCNVDRVDLDIWNDLANISQVFLDGNRLQSLPSSVAAVSIERTHFSIGRNPWKCSCDASWMSSWLKSVSNSLITKSAITCFTPSRLRSKNIMSLNREMFCVDPISEAVKRALTISISSAAAVGIVLFSFVFIVYQLRVKLYTRWKFHPFDRDECIGEDMVYDVFLSCSSDDNLPHGNDIREQLEQRGYLVCYPPRDFLAGEAIYDNIYNAVVRSKRTVCFLTANFLQRFVT